LDSVRQERLLRIAGPAIRAGDERKGGIMRRAILIVPLVLAAVLLLTSTAVADTPTREELPAWSDFVDTFCGFPVLFEFEQAHPGTVTLFYDQDGNLVRSSATFPGLTVTATNLETGESLAENLSGFGVREFNADGSTTLTAPGPWGVWPRINGVRGRFITMGRVVEVTDATGALVSRTLEGGRLIDVCAELAS
jgi:hypothetical protein